jgi:SagB-type dehydrogenase family enzyme
MAPEIFLRIIDGKVIAWDYVRHTQFEIDSQHLERLIALCAGAEPTDSAVDQTLQSSGILKTCYPKTWGWDCLSRIFHCGTQIGLKPGEDLPVEDGAQAYVDYCTLIVDNMPPMHLELSGEVVTLPPPDWDSLGRMNLKDALLARQSCRVFNAEPLTLAEMATMLWAAFGAVHGDKRYDLEQLGLLPIGYRRTSPSGGSLQTSEPYLVVSRIHGLPSGIYHYRSHKHELSVIQKNFDPAVLGSLLGWQNFANDLAYGIFIVSRFQKMWWKYQHSRAYRVALLDIGCLVQTFQLICAAQGIQSWPSGHLVDEKINSLLGLDTDCESVMFFVGADRGAGATPKQHLSILQSRLAQRPSQIA